MDEEYHSYIDQFFRKSAPAYDLMVVPVSSVRQKVVDLTDAKEGFRILDVCTGTGAQALAFARRGYDVVGIDLSEEMLRIAQRKNRYENVRFEVMDAARMPFKDSYFDVSCISFGLHDMPHDAQGEVLDEMRRVSERIVLVDYHIPQNRINRWFYVSLISLYESKYFKDFAKRDLQQLLQEHGLRVIKKAYGLVGFLQIFVCEVANSEKAVSK